MTIETFRRQLQDGPSPYRAICAMSPQEYLRGPFWPIWD